MALAPTHPEVREAPTALPAGPAPRRWRAASDEFLVRAAARGHDGALAAIHDRYRAPLERYCRTIVLHHQDAEDAAQAALAAALRALVDRRAQPQALRAWLYRIAHREALAVLRRRPPTAAGDDVALTLLTSTRQDPVEGRADLAELLDQLRALPERSRSALVLHELAGLSFDEVAETLEITPGAARQAAYEARTKLRAGRPELTALFPAGPALALAGGAATGGAGLIGTLLGGAGVAAKCAAVCATIGVVGAGSYTVVHPPAPRDERPAKVERDRPARAAEPAATGTATEVERPVTAAESVAARPSATTVARRRAAVAARRRADRARARREDRRVRERHGSADATTVTPAAPDRDVTAVVVEESPVGGSVDQATSPTPSAPAAPAASAPAVPAGPAGGSAVGTGEITGAATKDVVSITVE